MKRFFNIIVFFLLTTVSAFSEIKIELDNNNPAVQQHVVLTVEFTGEKKLEYKIEGIEKFKIISMVSRTNYVSINKEVKYSKADIYTLCPQEEGNTILKVTSKEGSISNKIAVNILKKVVQNTADEKFFLEITSYDRDYFLGEKIPFSERLMIKSSVNNYNYVSTPMLNGFSIKNITPRDSRGFPIPKRIIKNEKEEIELVLFRSILEPVSIGKKLIKTGGISITENLENQKINPPIYLGFKELEINILPLPKENMPKNFQGVIGKLNGKYNWTKEMVDGKKAVILNLKLYGDVNLDKLEKIVTNNKEKAKYNIKENLISYDEQVVNSIYRAEKEYKITFFLNKEEDFLLSTIKIPYFNPVEKQFEEYIIHYDYYDETNNKTDNKIDM